jgi:phosphate transport system permease protein
MTLAGMAAMKRRRVVNRVMNGLAGLAAFLVILPLVVILAFLLYQGWSALNLDFFTQLPKPVGEVGGGMANAIVGSLILIGLASCVGLPVGILGGLYLAESRDTRLPWVVRFLADVLNGVPSIVIGIFAYTILVLPLRRFSAVAGGIALGVIMIPIVLRTTEEIVRLVPSSLREAGLALGVPQWKVVLRVVLPTARGGVITGAMVAIARIAGETAPLLFTAFGNRFWHQGLDQPIAALPLQIFSYAIAPYEDWHRQAWAGALVLITLVLIVSLLARLTTRGLARAAR